MKKFYIPIFTAVLLASSFLSQGGVTYTSISSNPGNLTMDDPAFWVGPYPGSPCLDCTINIYSSAKMVHDDGSSSSTMFGCNGNPGSCPFLNHITLIGGSINVIGNTTVSINTYLELQGVTIVLGSNGTDVGKFFVNDQISMDAASSVRIGNDLSYIDANNGVSNAIQGTIPDFANGGTPDAGIFSLVPGGIDGEPYSIILNVNGNGTPINNFAFYGASPYIVPFNCPGAAPGGCNPGIVNGPATTAPNATFGVVFKITPILPVNLVQFLADKNDDGSVKLSWSTAQEQNANDFEIERSGDQAKWTTLGSVKAKGYSSTTTNYSFTDKEPIDGKGYYRLKMVDLDQKFQYSPTVAVSSTSTNNQALIIYKNPYNDMIRTRVHVSRAQNLVLTVTDMVGRTFISQNYPAQAGNNYINLQPNVGSSGMYILRIHGDSYDQTVKIEKQ